MVSSRLTWEIHSLGHLATQFEGTVPELRKLQMAHGDLQHGNMVVTPARELKLIDYDGMYVLGMPVGRSHEKGHVNYQHPQRDASHFGRIWTDSPQS